MGYSDGMIWLELTLFAIYSFFGWLFMATYVKECKDFGMEPFHGSYFKITIASLFAGAITTIYFILAILATIKEKLKNKF
jgi:hypothetical protein